MNVGSPIIHMAATSNNYFRPIRGRSSIADHLLEWAQSKAPVWQQHNSFDLARPPISLIKQDPLVSQLLTGFNADPAVIRMEPQRLDHTEINAAQWR